LHALALDLIADWIKSQTGELPELTKLCTDNRGITYWGYTEDQLLEFSARYKAKLAQHEAVLEQAREALQEMQWYVTCDTTKSVLTLAAVHGFGPTPETHRIVKAIERVPSAITAINELIGEKK
jgi:hypothetical protein